MILSGLNIELEIADEEIWYQLFELGVAADIIYYDSPMSYRNTNSILTDFLLEYFPEECQVQKLLLSRFHTRFSYPGMDHINTRIPSKRLIISSIKLHTNRLFDNQICWVFDRFCEEEEDLVEITFRRVF